MLVELGGGTNPHPRADIVVDLHHPRGAPMQDAAVTPWAVNQEPVVEDGRVVLHSEVGWSDGQVVVHDRETGPGQSQRFAALADDVADEVYASHFMEHIHRGQPLINVMNEAWRVLKPGGTFTMILPLTGYTNPASGMGHMVAGWQPYADPTHVNYWWFPEALLYFCEGPFKPHANYGIHVWAALGPWVPPDDMLLSNLMDLGRESFWTVRSGWEGVARLVKP